MLRFSHFVPGFAAALLVAPMASAQLRLTDVFQFSTNSEGASAGGQVWDTVQGGSFAIWISANGNRLNGMAGQTSTQSIDFLMAEGTYNFQIWGQVGNASTIAFGGMNLFFGDSSDAGISVFAPARNDFSPPPTFLANASAQTLGPSGTTPGSGSLSYTEGDLTATLTSFFYANPTVFAQDEGTGSNRVPGGGLDYYGEFTIEVVPAPATTALVLCGAVLSGRRRR